MEFFLVFCVCLFFWLHGVFTGWNLHKQYTKNGSQQPVLPDDDEKNEQEDLVRITIEEHHGVFYVYNKKDNTFMAQGKNRQEIEEVLSSRFPGKRFAATLEELQKLGVHA
jgi:hypothetical protein